MNTPEKDKRKEMPARAGWMHTRGYALVFCGLFFISGLVNIFDVPVLGSSGVARTNYVLVIGLTAIFLGGAVGVLFVLLHTTLETPFFATGALYFIPTTADRLQDVVVLIGMTVMLMFLVRQMQRFRLIFKVAVYLNYLVLVLLLFHQFNSTVGRDDSMQRDYVPSPVTCEYAVSDAVRIRAVSDSYKPYGIIYSLTTYSITHDGGQTWQEFLLGIGANSGACPDGQLSRIDSLDENVFWIWQRQAAVFTQDGGQTWALWHSVLVQSQCVIGRIHFISAQQGHIECDGNYPILRTDDGGFTWHINGG